jgi:hypothetical protein
MSLGMPSFGASRRGHYQSWIRMLAILVSAALVATVLAITWAPRAAAAATNGSPCGATINPIVCENSQTSGLTDSSVWDISGAGDSDIQGFATDISVNAGGSIGFKIDTTLSYKIDIYRLGYYGSYGARLWQSNLSHAPAVAQGPCASDPSTLLYDCGTWSLSATWNVPTAAVSGVYIARLTATNGHASHITFVVRNDSSKSDIVYQTSDQTWQAYNAFDGSDFYTGTQQLTNSQARAFKISYNRPFATRGANGGRDFLFANEYPTIRYLESNGYDVSYMAGVDVDRYGSLLLNHKTYMSVGHDEYWSQAQRDNVQNARDHGVNLMFLSGNEMYWHTRFEPSIDGTNTAYRTLVCYKETWDNAKIDTSTTEATATWRDPRFQDSPGGGNPENGLTGTMFRANFSDLAITVSGAEGKTRLWRNTTLGSVPDTSTTALMPNTIGYESDEDVDNGFRPAGLVDLSTTVGPTPQLLTDYGNTTPAGTTTHHVTLYRASSGALVFSAGTIQWAWGLDGWHDGGPSDIVDTRMQQATMNMLADMQTFPTTLQSGLVMPAASTDTIAPTAVITSPVAGASLANGSQLTVTGTATDAGGGRVAGIEVSIDGGTTWHPASGTSTWTYTGILPGTGSVNIKARATDDSSNTQTAPASVGVTVNCPCSIFGNASPTVPSTADSAAVTLGTRFTADADGWITGIRFYKGSGNTGTHLGKLWTASGTLLASATFTGESATGWQTVQFSTPVAVTRNTEYVASYYAPNGGYAADPNYFGYGSTKTAPLHALGGRNVNNGVYLYGNAFPNQSYTQSNYYVDVAFTPSGATSPVVLSTTPASGATAVPVGTAPTATFSTTMDASSLQFTVKNSTGAAVAGTVSYDVPSATATFTPTQAFASGASFTATVTGSDTGGHAMGAPATWTFTTAGAASCPCTIFPGTATPAGTATNDGSSVELGVKFTSEQDGVISGVRFYKAATNIGTHTGSLWTAAGQLLATATFANESASGWQTVTFSSPVAIGAGQTYIASYHAPNGNYSLNAGAFSSFGIDNPPLHVPASGAVYSYDSGAPLNSSDSNYWVDVIFNLATGVTPTVVGTTPADTTTGVPIDTPITATMSIGIQPSSASFTVTGPGGAPVAGATSYDSTTRTLKFIPTANLGYASAYTATVSGVVSAAGVPMAAPVSWTFTTHNQIICPCTLFAADAIPSTVDAGDGGAVSLGVKFVPSATGYVSGVRFYKAAANTGAHTGSLWTSGGTRLATGTFTNETATGWQTLTFSTPIPLTVGATYVVSYYAPNGHYSADGQFFNTPWTVDPLTGVGGNNGVYNYGSDTFPSSAFGNTNYWVDPIFQTGTVPDVTAPAVESSTPIPTASSVVTNVTATATFSKPVNSSSIVFTVKDALANAVTGAVTYNSATKVATFTPSAALARGVTYTATVSASDTVGNAMATPYSWTFTTMQPSPVAGVCPCGVWDDSAVPTSITAGDSASVELGVKFTSDRNGTISGVRFYKGPQNTGTHTVSLWSATGTQLATATVTTETASGWQTASFATPFAITAGTTYLVSYHTNVGSYSVTGGGFATAGVDSPPLHVPAHGGAYVYGAGFPANASDSNYWVDPVLVAAAPPVISQVAASGSGTTATVSWTTDTSTTSQVDYGTSATALNLSGTVAGSSTSHTVTLTGLAANTRYYYRVTSTDSVGNSVTSPPAASAAASYAPATAPIGDTTSTNFAAGTVSSTYVAANGDGEVVLAPTAVAEFTGTTLPSGWTSSNTVTGGSSTVSAGTVTVKGANLTSTATYSSGKFIETLATLDKNQSIGWVTSSNSSVKIALSVNSSNQLIASVNDGFVTNSTATVMTGWTAVPHKFRIEWTSNAVTFYVDDVQKYTRSFNSFYSNLRPLFADTSTTDANLVVNWIRVGQYAAAGSFTSRVFDGLANVGWDALTWDATVPTGTTLTVKVRTGNTPTPDGAWSAYATVPSSGTSVGKTGRYLQYQLSYTASGNRFVTPTVRSLQAAFHVL